MQNRYTGDIGDFAKYALLRALAPGYSLGVAWYLYPDEDHNKDGRHVDYLANDAWRRYDPPLFDGLKGIVRSGARSVTAVENANLLPGASFSRALLNADEPAPPRRRRWRKQWFSDLVHDLAECGLVFADPDNGLCEDTRYQWGSRKFWKRLPLGEAHALAQGRPAVIYHHNSYFKGGHAAEIQHWLSLLKMDAVALYWRRISPRTFFVLNPDETIQSRASAFADNWAPHLEFHTIQRQRR